MNLFNPQPEIAPTVLATDLDGTLIPLPDTAENNADLIEISKQLIERQRTLIFATGRHYESVIEAIDEFALPTPNWIVCDVGSTIYQRVDNEYKVYSPYENHLSECSKGIDRAEVEKALSSIEGLKPQPVDHQQRFKISYESEADTVDSLVDTINTQLQSSELPFNCMGSLDPFMNCGLLDVMPQGVSKAYALIWLSTHANFSPDEVIYSGDSGNDYAALASGFRAILVANRSPGLAEKVSAHLQQRDLNERLYLARKTASSGVLEGCRYFGLIQ